ncbi:MAG: hypothetical protein ACHQIO_01085 [Nevskiales bacterium]
MDDERTFQKLLAYLARVPAIEGPIGKGRFENGCWWVKFSLDISHSLAWNVVQEFGHVLNYGSISEQLPTVFKPVSPPPYMNGGPAEFLSWVIEAEAQDFTPDDAAEWLEGRLPRPVEDLATWENSDSD